MAVPDSNHKGEIKFIRSLKQAFGYCGELENPARMTDNGLIINDLIWNLKGSNGEFVGNGIFIWFIALHCANGYTQERVFRMGVAKKDTELYNHCISGL